jgi:hypothetical protein
MIVRRLLADIAPRHTHGCTFTEWDLSRSLPNSVAEFKSPVVRVARTVEEQRDEY